MFENLFKFLSYDRAPTLKTEGSATTLGEVDLHYKSLEDNCNDPRPTELTSTRKILVTKPVLIEITNLSYGSTTTTVVLQFIVNIMVPLIDDGNYNSVRRLNSIFPHKL